MRESKNPGWLQDQCLQLGSIWSAQCGEGQVDSSESV